MKTLTELSELLLSPFCINNYLYSVAPAFGLIKYLKTAGHFIWNNINE